LVTFTNKSLSNIPIQFLRENILIDIIVPYNEVIVLSTPYGVTLDKIICEGIIMKPFSITPSIGIHSIYKNVSDIPRSILKAKISNKKHPTI
jgi:hypothetical protein